MPSLTPEVALSKIYSSDDWSSLVQNTEDAESLVDLHILCEARLRQLNEIPESSFHTEYVINVIMEF